MIRAFEEDYGVEVRHAWGMTEMSPLGSVGSIKPQSPTAPHEDIFACKAKQGCAPFGVEMKIVDGENNELPWDGKTLRPAQGARPRGRQGLFQGEGGEILDDRTASSTPATSPPSIPTATCRSPTAPRT